MRNAIGIDIGGTKTRAARVSANGALLDYRSWPTALHAGGILEGLIRAADELRDTATCSVGIGVPARVDARTGTIRSGGFVDLSALPFTSLFAKAANLPVFADNDASMALVGEARIGAARGLDNVVMLTIGTGIGGAILSDGRIFHGAGMAGELGHVTVRGGGHPCKCGRTGCLETESSGTAFQRHVKEAGFAAGTPIADLLSSPEPEAAKVIAAWAKPLRAGIDSLVAAFGPELVVLGGGLGAPAIQALEHFPATSPWFQYRIAAAELGDEAGVIGAALAAMERLR